jgi:hypothetical protein
VPGSKALGERLATEERKLADAEERLASAAQRRPKVHVHDAAMAHYVTEVADLMTKGDVATVGPLLRRVLSPFQMVPNNPSYILRVFFNVGVCAPVSSGGVLLPTEQLWIPVELVGA